jgi:hypothetical protein
MNRPHALAPKRLAATEWPALFSLDDAPRLPVTRVRLRRIRVCRGGSLDAAPPLIEDRHVPVFPGSHSIYPALVT